MPGLLDEIFNDLPEEGLDDQEKDTDSEEETDVDDESEEDSDTEENDSDSFDEDDDEEDFGSDYSDDDSSGDDLDDLDVETLKKRFRDTQKWANEQNKKAKELEKLYNQLKSSGGDPAATKRESEERKVDIEDEFSAKFEEDPEEAIKWMRKQMNEEILSVRQEVYAREIERQEKAAKTKHDDYDDVVTDYLIPLMQEDPSLKQKWQKLGGTAEAAYELGKKRKEFEEFSSDPDAFIEKRKKTGNAKPRKKTLSSENSTKAVSEEGSGSLLDEVLSMNN